MSARRTALLGAAMLALAACSQPGDHGFQGWVEADMIFVSPDEYGRVETLSVREGDVVEKGAPLFAVDPDLQQNDVEMATASLTNATLASERAQSLLKTLGRHAESGGRRRGYAPHGAGAACHGADEARAPQGGKPGGRIGPANLLPGPANSSRPAGRWSHSCRRATSRSGFSYPRRRWRRSHSEMP